MDVKEKLVELIAKAKEIYASDYTDHTEEEYIAETLLDNGVTVQDGKDTGVPTKWIPVTERLPKNYEAVLTFDGRSIHIMAHHHDFKDPFGIVKGNFMGYAPITHWMPLPEPPKEGGAKENENQVI